MDTHVINDSPYEGASCEMFLMTYQQRFTFERKQVLDDGDMIVDWARKLWVKGENIPDEDDNPIEDFRHIQDMKRANLGFLMYALAMVYKQSSLTEEERKN